MRIVLLNTKSNGLIGQDVVDLDIDKSTITQVK